MAQTMVFGKLRGQRCGPTSALVRRLLATTLVLVLMLAPGADSVTAQEAVRASTWERTSQTGLFERLISTPDGALFAVAGNGTTYRTTDDGSTWTRIDAPTRLHSQMVAVDPTDPGTMYVEGNDALYKTDNNARTWKRILPLKSDEVHGIAVSPADRSVVYVSVGNRPSKLLRSLDGGQTWETIQEAVAAPGIAPARCDWWTHVLLPHPSDAQRVFTSAGCFIARDGPQGPLKHSTDQGQTWANVFDDPQSFPSSLVGGQGTAPERFYLVAARRLLRSDDSGLSWSDIYANETTKMSALAYDPSNPDRVFVALELGSVLGSTDGGATWADLGSVGDNLRVYALALSADGQTVIAAANQGIWRLRSAD